MKTSIQQTDNLIALIMTVHNMTCMDTVKHMNGSISVRPYTFIITLFHSSSTSCDIKKVWNKYSYTVFWIFFPLWREGKIGLQCREVFVSRYIGNVVRHSCSNDRGQHTVRVLSFSGCLLYFSRCLPNDRETKNRNVRISWTNR